MVQNRTKGVGKEIFHRFSYPTIGNLKSHFKFVLWFQTDITSEGETVQSTMYSSLFHLRLPGCHCFYLFFCVCHSSFSRSLLPVGSLPSSPFTVLLWACWFLYSVSTKTHQNANCLHSNDADKRNTVHNQKSNMKSLEGFTYTAFVKPMG